MPSKSDTGRARETNSRARFFNVLTAAGVFLAASCLCLPLVNTDMFWHLSAGKYMLAHTTVPARDFLSWSRAGAGWTDFEWLLQPLYYFLYSRAGYAGLFALKFTLLAGLSVPVLMTLRLYGLTASAFAVLPLLAVALLPSLDIRPENFSLLLFALTLFMLEKIRLSPPPGKKRRLVYGLVSA
ncbi:MAG: hypothetical protein PHW69_08185, partial [Elusimicrobiaceae bacterium]|nr:hypothetical protein [Elusimicrobiaceae bacterium]